MAERLAMSATPSRHPDSAHWLFLYLLYRMKEVLTGRNLINDPGCNNWVRQRHVMFIVADELRRNMGLDFGLQTTLHIEEIAVGKLKQIAESPTLINICHQCEENGWILIKPRNETLHELTLAGRAVVEQALRENRPITGLGHTRTTLPVRSILATIHDTVDRWAVASMARLPDFYRDVVLRNALSSRNPVAHYVIPASAQLGPLQRPA
jgi:hypothetical protein